MAEDGLAVQRGACPVTRTKVCSSQKRERVVHSAVMGMGGRNQGGPRLTVGWSQVQTYQVSAKFFRLAELRKLKQCEQVAAVCYRVRAGVIEFLLVQTGKGRWIFPKGSVEPGLTHAQAAALEAFEEAGVHGRMEEACFTRYLRRKRPKRGIPRRNPAGKSFLSTLIFVRSCDSSRPRSPIEIPAGFLPRKRNAVCRRTAHLILGPNSPAWSIVPWLASSDYAAGMPDRSMVCRKYSSSILTESSRRLVEPEPVRTG